MAVRFVDWLTRPKGERWIEVGCGTGALTKTILAGAEPSPTWTRMAGSTRGQGPTSGNASGRRLTSTDGGFSGRPRNLLGRGLRGVVEHSGHRRRLPRTSEEEALAEVASEIL